jgi:hypothetical protein
MTLDELWQMNLAQEKKAIGFNERRGATGHANDRCRKPQ